MKVGYTDIFKWLTLQKNRYILLKGGAGSSKSYSLAQHLLLNKAYQENGKDFLVMRKTLPSLKLTAFKLIHELLDQYGLQYDLNKSELNIYTPNSCSFYFRSLDMPEKIKSAEFNYIWMEEATEFNYTDFQMLDLRLRKPNQGHPNQMFMSFNPIGMTNWIYTELIEKNHPNLTIHNSNYKDNPFLDDIYISKLQDLINQDKNYYKVYTLGEWGALENIIYSNYELIDQLPSSYDEVFYGVDFGFNNPSAIVKIMVKDEQYFIQEKLYREKLTNNDLITELKKLNISHDTPVYADSAEPARIEEIYKNEFNIHPSIKDKNSVKDGIDYIKRHHLFITKDSINLIKEIGSYQWREDKDGNILDEPVKYNDHLLDALRYAMYTHEINRGGTTDFILG